MSLTDTPCHDVTLMLSNLAHRPPHGHGRPATFRMRLGMGALTGWFWPGLLPQGGAGARLRAQHACTDHAPGLQDSRVLVCLSGPPQYPAACLGLLIVHALLYVSDS